MKKELADKVMGAFVGVWCGSAHEFYPKRETMKLELLPFDPDDK